MPRFDLAFSGERLSHNLRLKEYKLVTELEKPPLEFSPQRSQRRGSSVWTLDIVKTIQGNIQPNRNAEKQKDAHQDTAPQEVVPGKECQHEQDDASPDDFKGNHAPNIQ